MKVILANDFVVEGTPNEILEFFILQQLNNSLGSLPNKDEEQENE